MKTSESIVHLQLHSASSLFPEMGVRNEPAQLGGDVGTHLVRRHQTTSRDDLREETICLHSGA